MRSEKRVLKTLIECKERVSKEKDDREALIFIGWTEALNFVLNSTYEGYEDFH